METEYISREEMHKANCYEWDGVCGDYDGHQIFIDNESMIDSIPAADVRPVVYGKWIDKPSGAYGRWQSWCSACGKHSGIGGIESNRHKPFCPNCGASMMRQSN